MGDMEFGSLNLYWEEGEEERGRRLGSRVGGEGERFTDVGLALESRGRPVG